MKITAAWCRKFTTIDVSHTTNQILNVSCIISFNSDFCHIFWKIQKNTKWIFYIHTWLYKNNNLLYNNFIFKKKYKDKNSIKVYWLFTSIGHELHSRLNNFHPGYLKTFLAFMQTSQHRRIFSFSNEKWESSQITSEVVFELILWSLPTSSNAQRSINPFSRMEWPVINHLWITFILLERLSINIKLYIWEDRWNSIVMPFIITNLQNTKKIPFNEGIITISHVAQEISILKVNAHFKNSTKYFPQGKTSMTQNKEKYWGILHGIF